MSKRFTLYGLPLSGPSYKVALMLSLCGQDFAFSAGQSGGRRAQGPGLSGKEPLRAGAGAEDHSDGRIFVQSPVNLEVLSDRLGKLGGADRWERLKAREAMFWCMDRLGPPLYRSRLIRLGRQLPVAAHRRNVPCRWPCRPWPA